MSHRADTHTDQQVREQRLTNLLQSLLLAACLGATPAIQQIPTGVLFGYFMLLAIKSLEGSQFWERLLLLATDPRKRIAVMQREHAAYLQCVPWPAVVRFTLLQLVYLLGVWALTTWAGVAGVAFPLPIMALVPLRQYVLPRLFDRTALAQLDAASWDEAPPVPDRRAAAQVGFVGVGAWVGYWRVCRRCARASTLCCTSVCAHAAMSEDELPPHRPQRAPPPLPRRRRCVSAGAVRGGCAAASRGAAATTARWRSAAACDCGGSAASACCWCRRHR